MKSYTPKFINIRGELFDLATPRIMGIVNVTPDSFFNGSRAQTEEEIINRTRVLIDEGTEIIDLGAYSSRPGAEHISAQEEMDRPAFGLNLLRTHYSHISISIDTFRAALASTCLTE